MKIGDIVNMKEDYNFLLWYHSEKLIILDICIDIVSVDLYESIVNIDKLTLNNTSRINKIYLELNQEELRKKKLKSI